MAQSGQEHWRQKKIQRDTRLRGWKKGTWQSEELSTKKTDERNQTAMNNLKPPGPLLFTGNVAENYCKFKQKYELYILASGGTKQSPEIQTAILLTIVGEEGLEIFNTSDLSAEDKKDPQKVLQALETYCISRANVSVERHIFFTREQREGESIDSYVTELRKLSQSCEFGEMKESLIKDRIISELPDNEVKTNVLNADELSLEKCLQICKNAELTRTQLKTVMHGDKLVSSYAVNNGRKKTTGDSHERKKEGQQQHPQWQQGIQSR
ncbi:hypothetical protein PR048_017145 [Dryococelus australis]|uniref:Retrotransposon gag domain-containing protein n=1 Tax=Dryococelus australis TaxID=614101 RepID=A0ABQ9H8X8_9NEOP|nr:hypothetical protein PR048_017145 [Dryococelus australis]